ncbi:MAG: Hpt domain-containing protein, partial [Spirochaetota bacterium]|nr:Hpt domain-containing protein [Spirochaetota bacterium]
MVDQSEYYRDEARELLEDIEQKLIELETQPEDAELLNSIFRSFHTIKGSGSMFGFDDVADFTHEIESLFDLLREKKLTTDKHMIDLSLAAKDHIHDLIFSGEKVQSGTGEVILQDVRRYIDTAMPKDSGLQAQSATAVAEEAAEEPKVREGAGAGRAIERTFRIKFTPQREFFLRGAKILPLLSELEEMGTLLTFTHTDSIPALDEIAPELSYCSWTILLTTRLEKNALKDVFIFVEEYSEVKIDLIDDSEQLDIGVDYKRIGEILYEQGFIDRTTVESIMREKERFGDIAVKRGILTQETLDSALGEQQYVRKVRREREQQKAGTTIRVKSERLDSLINLVGEIVTLQARLSQYTERVSLGENMSVTELESVAENMARLTGELRENTMDIRMVPLAETFNGFHRLVRDLSADLGKEIK